MLQSRLCERKSLVVWEYGGGNGSHSSNAGAAGIAALVVKLDDFRFNADKSNQKHLKELLQQVPGSTSNMMNEKKSAMLERDKKTSAAHKAKKEAAANARKREVLYSRARQEKRSSSRACIHQHGSRHWSRRRVQEYCIISEEERVGLHL